MNNSTATINANLLPNGFLQCMAIAVDKKSHKKDISKDLRCHPLLVMPEVLGNDPRRTE